MVLIPDGAHGTNPASAAMAGFRTLPVKSTPDGFIDLEGFFKGLKEGGFDGYVAYEMCSPLRGGGSEENLDATARIALETIRTLI